MCRNVSKHEHEPVLRISGAQMSTKRSGVRGERSERIAERETDTRSVEVALMRLEATWRMPEALHTRSTPPGDLPPAA